MSVFVSTEDGRVLLLQLDQRRTLDMGDFQTPLSALAVTPDGRLFGASDRLVYDLDLATSSANPVAMVPGVITGLDVDAAGHPLIATEDGEVLRLDGTGSLATVGTFSDGVTGGIARIGDFLFAVTGADTLASLSLTTGTVTPLLPLSFGPVAGLAAQDQMLHILTATGQAPTQVFSYDPQTGSLAHTNGLLGFTDRITDGAGGTVAPVTFSGTDGDEQFIGTALADMLSAQDGDDRLYARDGADTLVGGAGADLLLGENGHDRLEGGAGDDYLDGGANMDWALFSSGAADVDLQIRTAQDTGHGLDRLVAIENLGGSADDDRFKGNGAGNKMEGWGGDDTLVGRGGSDTLRGGEGDDLIRPGAGRDTVMGGAGFDLVDYSDSDGVTVALRHLGRQDTGGSGIDRIRDVEGIIGSPGDDRLDGNGVANDLRGGAGADILTGRSGDDTLRGGADGDELRGQSGNDILRGQMGDDTLFGGSGNDTLDGGGDGVTLANGGVGADHFEFWGQAGEVLRITDFDATTGDRIVLKRDAVSDLDDWHVGDASGGRTQVTTNTGAILLLDDTGSADVVAAWFI